ncbi:LLM class flavin-dependent oxidoreductase [Lactobacillus halodurans]|uniref:LLM class flavin-dependent oxidoreductase n=1 Tax=Companilactobacillus halodurans TaxID=2584183 RepID=A0A5P0ZMU6_9LACO|nr:LLM class flavin-dependent oxidoreductase [Companilactobacillus halodurans]MQS75544.1 LLM class flavin-dependent oxidoreductase [Companilactobacillus halodurans]
MTIDTDKLEFGLDTFGDVAFNDDGSKMTYRQSLQNILKEGQLADKLGIDVFALGEHHREEYSISSPEIMLSALASTTKNIKLSTAVTVLSSDDPVRVYERFATLDGISNGRAQIMLGRGSFTESFPLFGYDLADYNELFEEKIALFNELITKDKVTWSGQKTQSLANQTVYPRIEQHQLPVFVGIGGTPESVLRTAKYDYNMMIAIISGEAIRFEQYIELYKNATKEYGAKVRQIGVHSHGIITETDQEAYDIGWKYIKQSMDKVGLDRGWPQMTKSRYDFEVGQGAYYVGSIETVAQKIAQTISELDISRFDLVYGTGGQTESTRIKTIELYATKVIPRVKEILESEDDE